MGYTLSIGEPKVVVNKEYDYIYIEVINENHEKAPAFGEPTDNMNQRWPSYTAWRDFCNFTGLEDLFYNDEYGLMKEHPGEVPLKMEHKEVIDNAMKRYMKNHPNAVAGYSPKIDFGKSIYEDPDWPVENNYLTRLVWLKYWVDWALENCKQPIFKNT